MPLKEDLEALLASEIARLKRRADEGLLTDEDVARIPALAMAAERVQGLRAGDVSDERDAAALEKLTHGG